MDIQLIVVDLDGTLLHKDMRVSDRTAEVFARAKAAGYEVAVATGRSHAESVYAADRIGADRYMILITGAQLYDRQTKKNVLYAPVEAELSAAINNILDEYDDVYYQIYSNDKLYTTPHSFPMRSVVPLPPQYLEDTIDDLVVKEDLTPAILRHELPAEKYFILSPSVERLEEIRQRTQALGGLFVVYSLKHALEIVREDVNKGTAMQALREYTGIPREKIMVIGDSENDLDMFREGGFKVAVGNGFPCLKEQADYVAPSNEEDGVAEAVERFLLGEKE